MLIASIDLMNGKAVQLRRGKEKVLERDNPVELAREFDRYGETAVIDLDAAMGSGDNGVVVKAILKTAECRVGGGIRSVERAKELISWGAGKVIIGSLAFRDGSVNHDFLLKLSAEIGRRRVIIAADAMNEEIVIDGWRRGTGIRIRDALRETEKYCSGFLITRVENEGTLSGTDAGYVKDLKEITGNKITFAGGVNSIEDVAKLSELGVDAQVGMALYTGRISLSGAFAASLKYNGGLVPTITRDAEGEVLMLAYSSRESIEKTFETGRMWYFSRSRNRLWMKGETSGNVQELLRLRADCDSDAILATVRQSGAACHTGSYSCFGRRRFSLHELYEVVRDRLENPRPGSYTATLDDKLLGEKILEEAQEVVDARTKDEVIWEAADVLYFLTVLLAKKGVEIEDVLFELRRRKK